MSGQMKKWNYQEYRPMDITGQRPSIRCPGKRERSQCLDVEREDGIHPDCCKVLRDNKCPFYEYKMTEILRPRAVD